MTTDLVIVGTGGQGRECLDIALAMIADGASLNVVGYVDDDPSPESKALVEAMGFPILGNLEWLMSSGPRAGVIIGIGSGSVRSAIDRRFGERGLDSPVLVHPTATIGSLTSLGPGTCVWPGARLTTNVRAGRHVHINQNVTVGHDAVLGDYATLNPLAAASGAVTIGPGSTLGAGSVVLQGRQIGEGATVGASACVVRDVQNAQVVKGVPAR